MIPQTRWREDILKTGGKKLDVDSTKPANIERNGRDLYSRLDGINKAEEEEQVSIISIIIILAKVHGNDVYILSLLEVGRNVCNCYLGAVLFSNIMSRSFIRK